MGFSLSCLVRMTRRYMSTEWTSPLLTVEEAADFLRCSKREVWNLRQKRELRCTKVGRLTRFHIADLNSYIEDHKEHPPSSFWDSRHE